MALSAQEQALLESLTAKANEPEPVSPYTSVESIVRELVRISDKFSANPHDQQAMLDFLDSVINPSQAPEPANGA